MKNGKPFLGSSSVGTDLHQQTIQGLYYVMNYGMTPNEAASNPTFLASGQSGNSGVRVVESEFDETVIKELKQLGLSVTLTP